MAESGDMKLLGNFSQLIELVAIDSNYNPANPKLKVTALNAQKTAGLAAVGNVGSREAPSKVAVNERQEAYALLPGIVSRAGNMLKASDANKNILDDAKTVSRKILGRRKSAKVKDDPNTPANEANANHSASQMSYDNISGNFDDYVAILATVPGYTPNEADLTIAGLTATGDNLKAKNLAVNQAFAPMSAARGQRDQLLYLSDDSVVNIALLVKAYVRAALGSESQLFKQIKGLPFKRPNK
jgi:hypothetical protein